MTSKEAAKKLFNILHDPTMSWTQESVDAFNMAIAALTAQPETHEERTETHECDCISRQAAIDAIANMLRRKFGIGGDLAEITLAGLPSAQPERTGRWIDDGSELGCACPECGASLDEYISNLNEYNHLIKYPRFCPNCGAKMEVEHDNK